MSAISKRTQWWIIAGAVLVASVAGAQFLGPPAVLSGMLRMNDQLSVDTRLRVRARELIRRVHRADVEGRLDAGGRRQLAALGDELRADRARRLGVASGPALTSDAYTAHMERLAALLGESLWPPEPVAIPAADEAEAPAASVAASRDTPAPTAPAGPRGGQSLQEMLAERERRDAARLRQIERAERERERRIRERENAMREPTPERSWRDR